MPLLSIPPIPLKIVLPLRAIFFLMYRCPGEGHSAVFSSMRCKEGQLVGDRYFLKSSATDLQSSTVCDGSPLYWWKKVLIA